ncbi:hypothetical protein PR001_g16452 [Phytophthora rubi]|uniref:Uncharacterized protein n=1 Tax=Phytophthora rubi TaxID=129364 RepID=A0A6A3KPD5_9STRA|nr:hypothetical protein PR001_g16452 [Phytophthora rubi]
MGRLLLNEGDRGETAVPLGPENLLLRCIKELFFGEGSRLEIPGTLPKEKFLGNLWVVPRLNNGLSTYVAQILRLRRGGGSAGVRGGGKQDAAAEKEYAAAATRLEYEAAARLEYDAVAELEYEAAEELEYAAVARLGYDAAARLEYEAVEAAVSDREVARGIRFVGFEDLITVFVRFKVPFSVDGA